MKTASHKMNLTVPKEIDTEEHLSYNMASKEEMIYFPFEEIDYTLDCKKIVEMCLDVLKPRERIVIAMRFGLEGYEEHTLKETGKYILNRNTMQVGIYQESVRALEAKALQKIRKKLWNSIKF